MNEVLVPYIERYQDFINTENVGTTRRILKTLRVIAPKKAALGEAVSKYMRILDDAVDEEVLVRPVKSLLIDERDSLLSGRPTKLQEAFISPSLAQLPEKQSERLRQNLSRIMNGQLMDIDSRLTQSPFSSGQLVARNFITCWSVMSAFSIGALGIEPTPSKDSVKLMNAWGSLFKTGLPPWFAAISYIYFRTRAQKIPPSLSLNPSTVYRIPLDCT